MPRRINAETDMQILADIATGMLNKDIAVKNNVSASYVSKLALGKKAPDIYIPKPEKIKDREIDVHMATINEFIEILGESNILASDEEVRKIIKEQINLHVIRAKVYIELLKHYKGGE